MRILSSLPTSTAASIASLLLIAASATPLIDAPSTAFAQAPASDPDSAPAPVGTAPKLQTTPSRPTSIRIEVGPGAVFTTSGGTFTTAGGIELTGEGPVDRIADETALLLQTKKVLLVWVIDQSPSMDDDRAPFMSRVERIYLDLEKTSAAKGDALKTAIVGFGKKLLNHTPKPISDRKDILATIERLPIDLSGTELQFPAVQFAINTFRKTAEAEKRQLVVYLVTDESGDIASNAAELEATIAMAKKADCRVSVIGSETVFGSRYARIRPQQKQTAYPPEQTLDRGPETAELEQLQFDGLRRRFDSQPSGFGPYAQSRLARQSGGIFFASLRPEAGLVGRADVFYDADTMRPYLPDLRPRADYLAERDASPLRRAVVQAIKDLNPYENVAAAGKPIEMRTNFSIDRTTFATEEADAAAKADELSATLNQAQKSLEEVAALRDQEKNPRWRANYDLIYAQVCAYQARLKEYQFYIGEFRKNPKPVKNILGAARPTNYWTIHEIPRLLKPDQTQSQRDQADGLFREIQKEYAGTPWAERAKREINRGYGVELVEFHEPQRGTPVKLSPY